MVYKGEPGAADLGRDESFMSTRRKFVRTANVRWPSNLEGAYGDEGEEVELRGTRYDITFPLPIVADPETCRGNPVPLLVAGLVTLGLSIYAFLVLIGPITR